MSKPQEGRGEGGEASEEGKSNPPRRTLWDSTVESVPLPLHPPPGEPHPTHKAQRQQRATARLLVPHAALQSPAGLSPSARFAVCAGAVTPRTKAGAAAPPGSSPLPPFEVTPLSRKPFSDCPAHARHNMPVPFVPKSSVCLCYPPLLASTSKLLKMWNYLSASISPPLQQSLVDRVK